MKNVRLFFSAMLLHLASTLIATGSDDIDLVRDGHAQAREAIRTLSLKAEAVMHFRHDPSRPAERRRGEWWQDGLNYRGWEASFQSSTPDRAMRFDRLFADGRAKVLLQDNLGNQSQQPRGWVGSPEMLDAGMSAWNVGLFELRNSDQLKVLDALRDAPKYVDRVEREQENGKLQFRVDFKPIGQTRTSVWIDPSVNYLVRRMVQDIPTSKNRAEREVQEFRESPPGVFFPVRVQVRDFHKSALMSETDTVVSELRINEPIDRSKFTLVFPKMTYVEDRTRGVTYVAESDEEPMPEVPVRTLTAQETQQVQYPTEQVPERTFSWQRTAAWIGIGLVSVCAVAWFFLGRWKRQPPGGVYP